MDDAPGIGHNAPPPIKSLQLDAEGWNAWMASCFVEATKRRNELLASYQRFFDIFPLTPPDQDEPPAGIERWNHDIQGKAGDLRDRIRLLIKNAETLHDAEKEQVLIASRAIDGFLRTFTDPLNGAIREITRRQTVFAQWIEKENRRKAREEAERERLAAEAAMQQAAKTLDEGDLQTAADKATAATAAARHAEAKPAEHSRVHGTLGSVTSLRSTWNFVPERSDIMELAKAVVLGHAPANYLAFNDRRIKLAIRTEGVRSIPGCVIKEEAVAR